MKRILVLSLAAAVVCFSCKKSSDEETAYTCTTCKTTPDALAANDASSRGIYKGTFIGSTGTVVFDIANTTGTTPTCKLVVNGTAVQLNTTATVTANQPFQGLFSGTLNGQPCSLIFSVNADGSNPMVSSAIIPGHSSPTFNLIKETSIGLLEVFEGTYSTTKPETGTLNILLSRSLKKWIAYSRKTGDASTSKAGYGRIENNGVIIDSTNNSFRNIGTLNGDQINGGFVDNSNNTVTFSAKRTL